MAEARQLDRLVEQLDPHQHAAFRQGDRVRPGEAPQRHMRRGVGGVGEPAGAGVEAGADGEAERRAEGVGGAQEGADIAGFRHALGADAEIAAGSGGMHAPALCRGA